MFNTILDWLCFQFFWYFPGWHRLPNGKITDFVLPRVGNYLHRRGGARSELDHHD